jgi:hypothetical protein
LVLLSTRRERRLEGLLIAASAVGLALLANHCVPDVKIVDNEPDAGLSGASGAAGQAGATNTGGTDTGTPGLIGGPCLEDEICTVGQCNLVNSRCVDGEYGEPCLEDGHCVGDHCDLQSAGGAGGAATGVCGKYPVNTRCDDGEQCITGRCVNSFCARGIDGDPCYTGGDCDLEFCLEGICRLLPAGVNCDPEGGGNSECLSGDCHRNLQTCQLGAGDTPCTTDSDCMTGTCTGDAQDKTCVAPVVAAQTRRVQTTELRRDRVLDVEFRLQLMPREDQATVPLTELAFIYFFGVPVNRYQDLIDIPNTGNLTASEIQLSFLEPVPNLNPHLWMAIVTFTATADLTENDRSTGDIYFRVETPDGMGNNFYDQELDFSWPYPVSDAEFGTDFNENTRTVICRNVQGTWQREFGNSPSQIPDPCGWL